MPQEAIIGISYVVASAAVILLASFTAEGAEHIKETLTGALIWVTWDSVVKIAVPYVVIAAFHYVFRRQFFNVSFHPGREPRERLWDFIFYATFGVVVSLSVNVAGVLLIFSTLVIPATIAFLFVSAFGPALVLAWLSGALAIAGGIFSSFYFDITTGPLLVVVFGVVLVLAWVVRVLTGLRPEAEAPAESS